MKRIAYRTLVPFLIVALGFLMIASNSPQQSIGWKAPKEADNLKNPSINDPSALANGAKLFKQLCVVCHGTKGKGDGMAGINLKPRPTNLSQSPVQQQTDGAIFWKITEGRAPMASYKRVLSEEQRWQLVVFIRELEKK